MEKVYKKPFRCYNREIVDYLRDLNIDDKVFCYSLVDIEHLRSYASKYFKGKFKSKQIEKGFVMELK